MAFRIVRRATASWSGTVARGAGRIELGSGAFSGIFTERARVEENAATTNPEELIGAGLAGCFSMSVTSLLNEAGHDDARVRTVAHVRLEQTPPGFSITGIELETEGAADGLSEERFLRLAEQAKATCPVSRALAGTAITLRARLVDALPT